MVNAVTSPSRETHKSVRPHENLIIVVRKDIADKLREKR
jgi:hypothetical protein